MRTHVYLQEYDGKELQLLLSLHAVSFIFYIDVTILRPIFLRKKFKKFLFLSWKNIIKMRGQNLLLLFIARNHWNYVKIINESLSFYLINNYFFLVLVRLHRIMPWWDYSWYRGGPWERRGDTSTPATATAAEPRTRTGATQQSGVGCDKSESESESAEIATLARFWQAKRRW